MIKKIKDLYLKYKEIILYLIFGVGTTAVDWCIRFIFLRDTTPMPLVHTIDAVAWIAAVTFAYVTNRIFVFESKTKGFTNIFSEVIKFAGSRVVTFVIQEIIVAVIYRLLPPATVVVISSVIVVILNYIFSKLIVFRKSDKK